MLKPEKKKKKPWFKKKNTDFIRGVHISTVGLWCDGCQSPKSCCTCVEY